MTSHCHPSLKNMLTVDWYSQPAHINYEYIGLQWSSLVVLCSALRTNPRVTQVMFSGFIGAVQVPLSHKSLADISPWHTVKNVTGLIHVQMPSGVSCGVGLGCAVEDQVQALFPRVPPAALWAAPSGGRPRAKLKHLEFGSGVTANIHHA